MSIQTHFAHSTGFSEGFGFNILTGSLEGSSQQRAIPIPPGGAGTFRNWKMSVTAAPGSGKSLTYTIQKNNVNTALTVTIAGLATSASITGVDVHFAAGDLIDSSWSRTGSAVTVGLTSTLEYEPDVDGTLIFGFGGDGSTSLPHTGALSGGAWSNTSQTFRAENLIGLPGTITSLAALSRTAPAVGNPLEFALYKNGTKQDGSGGSIDTRTTLTNPATTATAAFTLPVVVGDYVRVTMAATSTSSTYDTGAICFMPDDPGNVMVAMTGIGTATTGTVEYNWPRGFGSNWVATESSVAYPGGITETVFTGMVARVIQAPGSGKSYTFTLRKNSTDTAITLTIADLATTGQMTGADVTIGSGDSWNLSVVASGIPASTTTENAVTLPGGPSETAVISNRNLLTGDTHTVTGSDNLIAGVTGTLEGDRSVLFSLDGDAHSVTGDGTFWVYGETNLEGTLSVDGTELPEALSALLDDLGT